jgi:proline iminopeptidase
MGKRVIIVSGILTALAFLAGILLDKLHSPLTDFVGLLCFPFFMMVFVCSLFLVRLRRSSTNHTTRKIFIAMRIAVCIGIFTVLIAVFWPRSYGTPPLAKRADMRYWKLPTGSRIAYTLLPAKSHKKPYPIIYLLGGPGGWVDQTVIGMMAPLTADGYDVYLYDQVGSGWSGRLAEIRDYTAERHKKDLEAIVKKTGAEKVILLGQSWGAILATLYAADNPGQVAKMILTGPGPIQPLHPEAMTTIPPDSLHLREPYYTNHQGNERASNIRTWTMLWFAETFGKKLASDKEADDFGAWLNSNLNWSTVCDTAKIRELPLEGGAGYYAQVMTVQSFRNLPDPRQKLKNSNIPVLVLKGQCDNQKWGFTNEYLQLFPNHRLVVIPDAGHFIFFEQPERYLSAIRDFLK